MKKPWRYTVPVVVVCAAVASALAVAIPASGQEVTAAATPAGTANHALRVANKALEMVRERSQLQVAQSPQVPIPPRDAASAIAFCPAGMVAVSGGGASVTGAANGLAASQATNDRSGWGVVGGNTSFLTGTLQAIAYCATSGQGIAARDPKATDRQMQALVDKVEAAIR